MITRPRLFDLVESVCVSCVIVVLALCFTAVAFALMVPDASRIDLASLLSGYGTFAGAGAIVLYLAYKL